MLPTILLLFAACVYCPDRDVAAPHHTVSAPHATVPDSLPAEARTALGAAVLSRLECMARVDTPELVCRDPADTVRAGGVRPQSVLGLNQVELVSTNVQYDSLTQIFSFDVTLENLLGEPIGTPDGVSVEGSRVVYVTGPAATAYVPPHDTGTVAVDNPDGYMNLTAVDQPYHFFAGILQPSEVSDTVHWRIFLSRTVEAFEFAVQVATPTPSDPSLFPPPPPGYVVPDDSLHVIQNPVDTVWIYYRRYVDIVFQDTASDEAKGEVIWSRNGRIIGGSPWAKSYLVEFPDPGATWPEFKSFMDSLQAEPAVKFASPETRRGPPGEIHLRYPSDGTGHQRSDWVQRTSSVAAFHAIRAPLAWGCETGTYAAARVRVGLLEWDFVQSNLDLAPSTPTIVDATASVFKATRRGVRI